MPKTDEGQSTSTEVERVSLAGRELMETLGIRFADPQQVSMKIAARLAHAQTIDELLDPGGPSGLRANLGQPFYIHGVEFMPGRFEDGPGFFALIDAVTQDNQPVVFTSGATNVLVQLAKGAREGWWDGVLVQAKQTDEPTANGFHPYRLVRA